MSEAEPYPFRGVPLSPSIAAPLIKAVLAKESPISRPMLVNRVTALHGQQGGKPALNPTQAVRKALAALRTAGEVVSASHGYWRLPAVGEVVPDLTDDEEASEVDLEDDAEDSALEQPPKLKTECEIGAGPHVVYVYYQESDRRLAKYENQATWPCKIGHSKGSAEDRIIGQGAAAIYSLPVIGLLIRTDNGGRTERVIHDALRLAGRALPNSPGATGTEWFNTTPEAVRQWFESYQSSLRLLSGG